MKPAVCILHATGTNRDREAAFACKLAGGAPEIVHINRLAAGERRLLDYQMLILPGGFSYGDDLGAGKLWAVALRHRLGDDLERFVESGRPVLGICNGFQALVKSGLLPGMHWEAGRLSDAAFGQRVTLARNDSARFECRWVTLAAQPATPCIWTAGLVEPIYCPVAHGEGKFVAQDEATLAGLEAAGLVALRYAGANGGPARYPDNPNGSQNDIAAVCNPAGTILGLMPHPEDHVVWRQHPRAHRGEKGRLGLPLFENGIGYAARL